MGKIQEGLNDCNQAIALDESYIKAYLRRAKCCMDLEKFEEAVRDYEKINKLEKNRGSVEYLFFVIYPSITLKWNWLNWKLNISNKNLILICWN